MLEKGRQLNITTSAPHAEQNDTLNTVHNELWVAADSASYHRQSPLLKTETNYISSMSLPSVTPSDGNDSGRARIRKNFTRCQRNMSTSKDCNIGTQMELDHINHKTKSNLSSEERSFEYEMNHVSNLPDCSSTNHWHCCSTPACPIHRSTFQLNAFSNKLLYRSSFPLCSTSCSPRAYRQHLVAIRRQIIRASLPVMFTHFTSSSQ